VEGGELTTELTSPRSNSTNGTQLSDVPPRAE
jgi:hypothetical protein